MDDLKNRFEAEIRRGVRLSPEAYERTLSRARRRHRNRRLGSAFIALALVSGIAVAFVRVLQLQEVQPGGNGENRVFFPVHRETILPGAILGGTLTVRNGCVQIVSPDAERLLLWPASFTFERGRVLDESGDAISPGDRVRLGGGELGLEEAESLIDQTIPVRCRAEGYWLVSEIVSS
jgi:hypothetical protein